MVGQLWRKMRNNFVATLSDVIEKDEKAILLLGDISVYAFRNLFSSFPNRVKNIGILEQATIGFMAGLSMEGLNPIFHTIAPFGVERCFEQLKLDFGYQNLRGSIITVGASYDYAALGPSHHAPGDVQCLLSIPNFPIVVPGTGLEFDMLFRQRYNEGKAYYRLSNQVNISSQNVFYGKGNIIRQKEKETKVTVISIGPTLDLVLNSTLHSPSRYNILYYTTVEPFDCNLLYEQACKNVVIVSPFYEGTMIPLVVKSLQGKSTSIYDFSIPKEFICKNGKVSDYSMSPERLKIILDNL